jgi:hypothetical protein
MLRRKALAQEAEKMRLEQRKSSWSSPLVVAIIAGTIALLGNALALFGNGLTAYWKSDADLKIEALRQQGNLVLEAIKTGDTSRARENLQLIAKAKLLGNDTREVAILEALKDGLRPGLPPPSSNQPLTRAPFTPETTMFDTPTNLTSQLACFKGMGVKYVARYYSSRDLPKRLTSEEAIALAQAGIKIIVVFLDRGTMPDKFSALIGKAHASAAIEHAQKIVRQPAGSAIFFAVDFDALERDVGDNIIPYFKAIRDVVQELPVDQRYKVGAYGSGSVITALLDGGLIDYSWLSAPLGWRGSREFQRSGNWDFQQLPAEEERCGAFMDRNLIRPGLDIERVAFAVAS